MKKERYRSLVAVYVMVINVRQEILLLRRANTGYRDGFYDMPAGHLEEGETLRQAALRELEEETGLTTLEDHLEFIELLHRMSFDRVYLDIFFQVKSWQGEASIEEPSKCKGVKGSGRIMNLLIFFSTYLTYNSPVQSSVFCDFCC